jgi:Coenzyme PQQ synthesis protein D (PqqD)
MSDAVQRFPELIPGLEVNEVADGYIVHQQDRGRVHYLNHTAAVVMELCNGRNAAADLPRLLQLAYGLSAPPAEEVEACLTTLRREGLIT